MDRLPDHLVDAILLHASRHALVADAAGLRRTGRRFLRLWDAAYAQAGPVLRLEDGPAMLRRLLDTGRVRRLTLARSSGPSTMLELPPRRAAADCVAWLHTDHDPYMLRHRFGWLGTCDCAGCRLASRPPVVRGTAAALRQLSLVQKESLAVPLVVPPLPPTLRTLELVGPGLATDATTLAACTALCSLRLERLQHAGVGLADGCGLNAGALETLALAYLDRLEDVDGFDAARLRDLEVVVCRSATFSYAPAQESWPALRRLVLRNSQPAVPVLLSAFATAPLEVLHLDQVPSWAELRPYAPTLRDLLVASNCGAAPMGIDLGVRFAGLRSLRLCRRLAWRVPLEALAIACPAVTDFAAYNVASLLPLAGRWPELRSLSVCVCDPGAALASLAGRTALQTLQLGFDCDAPVVERVRIDNLAHLRRLALNVRCRTRIVVNGCPRLERLAITRCAEFHVAVAIDAASPLLQPLHLEMLA